MWTRAKPLCEGPRNALIRASLQDDVRVPKVITVPRDSWASAKDRPPRHSSFNHKGSQPFPIGRGGPMDYMNGWAGGQFLIVIRAKGPIRTRLGLLLPGNPMLRHVWEHIVPSSAGLEAAEVRYQACQAAGTSRDGQAAARKLARLQFHDRACPP
jgi:hypothetical protein